MAIKFVVLRITCRYLTFTLEKMIILNQINDLNVLEMREFMLIVNMFGLFQNEITT